MNLSNPYIAGNPVGGTSNFIGRADVLREVLRVLLHPAQNAIVLFGQRRIGKTSVLQQLTGQLPEEGPFYSVYFDLQDKATWPLSRVLTEIARTIAEVLHLPVPDLGSDPALNFRTIWLPAILKDFPDSPPKQLEFKDKSGATRKISAPPQPPTSLVLLFDEFDVLADPKGGQAGAELFPYLRGLMTLDPKHLQFAFVIGRKIEDLESIALSLFKSTPSLRVSLLDHEDTLQLVRLSEQNETLHWSPEALEKVWELTHGHPFLTQQLCSRVWENLYDEDPSRAPAVTPEDVEQAIHKTLEASRNTMEWIWGGLPPAERVVISALAKMGNEPITQEQLEQMLRESGVRVVIRELQNAPQLLQDWDLLEPVDGGFQFKVELLRRWILKHKPLNRVQEELDRLIPLAENLYQAAMAYYRAGQVDLAENQVRQAVASNPNHARANELLADILISKGAIDETIKVLRALFENQPVSARPRLVEALLKKIELEKDETEQINLYRQILAIDPRHPKASKQVAEYERVQRQQEMAIAFKELQTLEKEKRYREALERVTELAGKYDDERDWQPEVDRIAQKVNLVESYQKAIGALHNRDKEAAIQGFIHVLTIEPDYEETTHYLHQVITNEDITAFKQQIQNLQKEKKDLQKTAKDVAILEKQVEALQMEKQELQNNQKQTTTTIVKFQAENQYLQNINKDIPNLKQQIQALQIENESLKNANKDIPRLESQVQILILEKQNISNDITKLKEQIDDLNQRDLNTETSTYKRLSPWNPFDYLRLLFWVFFASHHLANYKKEYGVSSSAAIGYRLVYTLTWLPLFLLTLALGIGTIPRGVNARMSSTYYLWFGGGIVLIWLLSVLFSKTDGLEKQVESKVGDMYGCMGFVAYIVALVVMFGVSHGNMVFILAFGTMGIVAGVVAGVIGNEVAYVKTGEEASAITGAVVGILTGGIAYSLARNLEYSVAYSVARNIAGVMGELIGGILGVVAYGVIGVLVFSLAFIFVVNISWAGTKLVQNASQWIKSVIFFLLIVSQSLFLWFCFFGGWQLFAN